jgi:hypothetical protein
MEDARVNDSEVAVIMLGNNDDGKNFAGTVDNLMTLAVALSDKNMQVYVCPLALPVEDHPQYEARKLVNDKLAVRVARHKLESATADSASGRTRSIEFLATLAQVRGEDCFHPDGVQYTPKAFKELAAQVFSEVVQGLVAVEWKHIKARY